MRHRAGASCAAALAVLVGLSWAICATGEVAALIAEAEALYDRWDDPFDFAAYGASLRRAIELWERALSLLPDENVQSRSQILNSLSQSYFEWAEGYLPGSREKEATYELGKDAALASLRLDPVFVATEASEGFRAALRSASDVAAIFWYGNTLGQWLNYHQFTAVLGGVRDVSASFERSIELDETYDGGGPHRAMAALLSQAYFVVGRSPEDAVVHFERSIEIAPSHLESAVSYAEFYARPTGDIPLFDALIAGVLEKAADPTVVAAFPFYNRLSIDRAEALVAGD